MGENSVYSLYPVFLLYARKLHGFNFENRMKEQMILGVGILRNVLIIVL